MKTFFKNIVAAMKYEIVDKDKYDMVVEEKELAIEENKDLKEQNRLLRRAIKQHEDEIKYMKEEKAIDQNFIVDLLAKILQYTNVPREEIQALERGVDVAKAIARQNYGK